MDEAWKISEDLQRQCPHYGVPYWLLVQNFYNRLKHSGKFSIDAAIGGALTGKSIDVAKTSLDDMAFNNFH